MFYQEKSDLHIFSNIKYFSDFFLMDSTTQFPQVCCFRTLFHIASSSFFLFGSAHRVFILHVLRFCASSLCTPFSFMSFRITSLQLSFGLPIFRCPLTSIFHVLIATSYSVFLSTCVTKRNRGVGCYISRKKRHEGYDSTLLMLRGGRSGGCQISRGNVT